MSQSATSTLCKFKNEDFSDIPSKLFYNEASYLENMVLNLEHNKKVIYAKYPNDFLINSDETIILNKTRFTKYIKEIIMHNLSHHTFARLTKSTYGVGVIAIRDIPKNTTIFDTTFGECVNYRPTFITEEEIRAHFREYPQYETVIVNFLKDFYLSSERGKISFPINLLGPNMMDVSFYLNHSDTPNLDVNYPEDCDMTVYSSNRDIKEGEELTINYRKFELPQNVLYDYMPFLKDKNVKNLPIAKNLQKYNANLQIK